MAEAPEAAGTGIRRLTEVSHALTYARSLSEVLDLTLDCAVDLLGSEKAVLMLNDDEGLLEIRAHRGIDAEEVDRFRIPMDETVLERLSGLLGPDARERFLGVPLVVRGRVIGLLAVRRPYPGGVEERDEWLLSALADQAAVALDGARHEALEEEVRELREGRSSKEHALRVMSHDLRSPLNAVQGYLELLQTGTLGPLNEDQERTVGRVRAVAKHLGSLLESVLEEVRLSGGQVPLHPEEVEVGSLLRDAAAVVQPAADEVGTTLTVDAPGGLGATLDPRRTRQILVQLLENAVKHCPEGSTVRLVARPAEIEGRPAVEIAVGDDGPGIPDDVQDEIFEPYRSLASKKDDDSGGFGLGLSIVRSLAERMGGRVELESRQGEGSTFRVTLPADGRDPRRD